jgi:hypothetical protein
MRKILLGLLVFCGIAAAQETTVSDTIYDSSGGLANGTITVTPNEQFEAVGGAEVYQIGILVFVNNGAFSVKLYPNDSTINPASGTSYSVRYNLNNQIGSTAETWVVPTSGSPVNLATVRTFMPPTPAYVVGFGTIAAGTNTSTLVMGSGGVLTFSGSGVINADQINGAAVPASGLFLGSNSSRQLTALTATTATAGLNLFSSTLQGLVPLSGGGTTNFLRADGTWAAPPGGGSGTGNAAAFHSVTFSTTPALNCGSSTGGTVDLSELTTALTAAISPTISTCRTGQLVSFEFTQDATGGRIVTWPSGWTGMCQPSPVANITTAILALWDGTTAAGFCSASGGPAVIPLQAAPGSAPPSGSYYVWPDSTGLFLRGENSAGTIFQMAKELAANSVRCAGGANIVDFACTEANMPVVPLSANNSGTFSGPAMYLVCTSTCTLTVPVPVAGAQYCAFNDDNVSTVITLSAIGSSARYESTARTSYGTAGTGTFVSGGAVGDFVCIVGRDSTHYSTLGFKGTWTAN